MLLNSNIWTLHIYYFKLLSYNFKSCGSYFAMFDINCLTTSHQLQRMNNVLLMSGTEWNLWKFRKKTRVRPPLLQSEFAEWRVVRQPSLETAQNDKTARKIQVQKHTNRNDHTNGFPSSLLGLCSSSLLVQFFVFEWGGG